MSVQAFLKRGVGNIGFVILGVTSTDITLVIISLIFPHGLSNFLFETLKEERTVFQILTLHNQNKKDQNSKKLISLGDLFTSQLSFPCCGKKCKYWRTA